MQRKLYYINTQKLKEESGIYKNIYIYIDNTLEPKGWNKQLTNMESQKDSKYMTSPIKNIVQLYHNTLIKY